MQVFVTGATGYVGSSVATAFRRAGHRVWGLTRTEAKARRLAQQEIEPVVGDLGDPKTYGDVAAECAVLIHAAFEYSASGVAKDKKAGLVIRPGCVYGGPGGLTAPWFADASAGKAPTVVGDGRSRWTMVHGDDLADAYLRVGESGLGGEVFDISDRSRATLLEMAVAAARAAGYRGEIRPVPLAEAAKTLGDFAEALALNQHVDARKAVRLLRWQPRHGGFLDEADLYYRAWRAHQG